MRDVFARVSAWADSLIPPEWDDDQRMRARFSILLPMALGTFAWLVGGVQLALGLPASGVITIVAGCLGLASMGLTRWTRSLTVSVNVQLALFQGAVCIASFLMGGSMSMPAVFSTLLIPILAAVMLSRAAAIAWGAVAAAWMVALYTLHRAGLTPTHDLAPEHFNQLNTVGGVLTVAIFVAVAIVMDAMQRERISNLERARRKAREATRAKSRFLANMSHELRTPLHGLLGNISLLGDTALDSEQRQLLSTAVGVGDSLLELVNEILDLSKIEAGRLTLQMGEVDLAACVRQVVTTTGPLADAGGLELVADLPNTLPRIVKADGKRLRQVLSNLVGNAIKFTEEGHVIVQVKSAPPGPGRAVVSFVVTDTGAGMNSAEQERLFLPFEQGDSSTSRRHTGTGLGLAISRRLVELMGGELIVESEPGVGSTFRFDVELEVSAPATPMTDARIEGLRILIVGAPEVLTSGLARMLTSAGADSVVAVPSLGDVADDTMLYDVVLTDPAGLGEQTALSDLADELECPLIVLSHKSTRELGHLPEGIDVVHKPVLLNPLARAIHNATTEEGRTGRTSRAALVEAEDALTVLVVDDNPVNRRVTQAYLQSAGYLCELAANGEEAVERFEERGSVFDAILMDCHMPVLDGYEATAKIRTMELAGLHVPIIALTADAMPGTKDKVLAAGMDDYLTKPFRKEELVENLQRHCHAKAAS